MSHTMTPAKRLSLLLPLANRDDISDADLSRRVFKFLHRFEARGLRLPEGEQELWDLDSADATELRAIGKNVAHVFFCGLLFDGPQPKGWTNSGPDDIPPPLWFPSLRFGAFAPGGRRRGRFTQIVTAKHLRHLVPFLAMHLLISEETRIGRCHAPARRNWKNECGRIFIWSGHGRPPKVCSKACGIRVKAKRVNEHARRDREETRAQQALDGRTARRHISEREPGTTRRTK